MKKVLIILTCLLLASCNCGGSSEAVSNYDAEGISYVNNAETVDGEFVRTRGTEGIVGKWEYHRDADAENNVSELSLVLSFTNRGSFQFKTIYNEAESTVISGSYEIYSDDYNVYYICCNYGPYTETKKYSVSSTNFASDLSFITDALESE